MGVDGGRSPRRRRWQELREQRRRGIFLLPSLLTTGNLFCGFFAIILAAESRYTEAAVAIFVAMVMDMLDGKVARLTKTTTQFGVEFDSLADVVSFGVAPAFMLYIVRAGAARPGGLARRLPVRGVRGPAPRALQRVLGRQRPALLRGLPIPAAAGIVAAVMLLLGNDELERWQAAAIAVGTYLVAHLDGHHVPVLQLQGDRFRPAAADGMLLFVVLAILIVATHPQWFLFLLLSAYV